VVAVTRVCAVQATAVQLLRPRSSSSISSANGNKRSSSNSSSGSSSGSIRRAVHIKGSAKRNDNQQRHGFYVYYMLFVLYDTNINLSSSSSSSSGNSNGSHTC
jgi:hypothetical protein